MEKTINAKGGRKDLERRFTLERRQNAEFEERILKVKAGFFLKLINLIETADNLETLSDLLEALKIIKEELKEAKGIKEAKKTKRFIEILEE